VLCTSDWEELTSKCSLRCLAYVVSDHSPLLLDCSPTPPVHRRFHFEEFWIGLQGFQEVVAEAWASVGSIDPFERLMLRLQATASRLTSWAAKLVGNVRPKLAISRELILRFDKAREGRTLAPHDI
jgi:hypothetical protein